jgi:hypothetical protein
MTVQPNMLIKFVTAFVEVTISETSFVLELEVVFCICRKESKIRTAARFLPREASEFRESIAKVTRLI